MPRHDDPGASACPRPRPDDPRPYDQADHRYTLNLLHQWCQGSAVPQAEMGLRRVQLHNLWVRVEHIVETHYNPHKEE